MKIFILFFIICFTSVFSENFTEYKVQNGDTLSKIAKEKLSDPGKWNELLKYNKISNPNLIKPGLMLKVPDYLAKDKPAEKPMAKLEMAFGNVKFKKENSTDWLNAEKGQTFFLNDTIRTSEKSGAQIQFMDNPVSTLQLREKSIIKIEKQKEVKGFLISMGEALIKTLPGKNNDIKFKISSPSAVAGVRGTEFNVAVDEQESTKLGCFEGLVEVSAQGETVKVPAGFGTSVKKGEKPIKPFRLLEKVKPKPIIKEDDTEN